tara:strand:+ start:596 stop:787 length:192 start_codon:yes stop_codon:yes gene_type:complete
VVTYKHRGKVYELLSDWDIYDPGRERLLLRDLEYCAEVGDWKTLDNRIDGGLVGGWIREIQTR